MYLLMTVFAFWDGQDAHQPQTGAAKAAERRPVACCPERSEKLTRLNFLPGNAILKRRLQKSQWKEKEKEREETDSASG